MSRRMPVPDTGAGPLAWARYHRAQARRLYRSARRSDEHAAWVESLPLAKRGRMIAPEKWQAWANDDRERARKLNRRARELETQH